MNKTQTEDVTNGAVLEFTSRMISQINIAECLEGGREGGSEGKYVILLASVFLTGSLKVMYLQR